MGAEQKEAQITLKSLDIKLKSRRGGEKPGGCAVTNSVVFTPSPNLSIKGSCWEEATVCRLEKTGNFWDSERSQDPDVVGGLLRDVLFPIIKSRKGEDRFGFGSEKLKEIPFRVSAVSLEEEGSFAERDGVSGRSEECGGGSNSLC